MFLALPLLHPGDLFDPAALLQGAGPWVLAVIVVIVFIETGLLFPFLPGDSLLFTAGLLSIPLGLPLYVLVPAAALAAIVGDQVGYSIGKTFGQRLFKPDARLFKSAYRDRADQFFLRYGARSLVLARFVPIVRTFIPPIVGTSSLPYRRFLLWNAIGGIGWALALSLAGFWLGKIPFIANNVDLIAVVIVAASVVPVGIDLLRRRASTPLREEG
ncbi:VTT domain-containing protein [Cryobacterium tepidiphilum]|uniref:Alkaline phosphatase n=1 Tax=Cryobacterium tepidiphilum TaxID=2486026 RepID=A0A3M8L9S7_9MICO|nr:VTT domain-containing protein [Cryobacterium tepidiphilum]RNE62200.1 alkaline phosphatase [Cryobacterium tepidiphilum]